MASLRCIMARLTDAVPPPTFEADGQALIDRYWQASNQAIALELDTTYLAQPFEQGTDSHYSLDLHRAVRQLTGNAIDAPLVYSVAVMFGGFYAHFPEAFGVMFDRGFVPPEQDDLETDPETVGKPREGCAIFLGAIANRRPTQDEYTRQVEFSTIHEMGHLFNLQHIEAPPNFLATSPAKRTHKPGAFHFEQYHIGQLSDADGNPAYWPGGNDFADLGPDAHYDSVRGRARQRKKTSLRGGRPLSLRLSVARDRFRYYEPLELDVSLRLRRSAQSSVPVPNVIDPGYSAFKLWIEEPSGERRLYRSPRRYCEQGLKMRLKPGQVFRRDISIFGESGGYTFRRVGVHRIWAELALSASSIVRSNTVEVDLMPARLDPLERKVTASLKTPAVAELLYHRLDRRRGAGARQLEDIVAEHADHPAAASMRYALARAYLATSGRAKGRDTDKAHDHLQKAADDGRLGDHQRELALSLLDQVAR